MDWHRFKLKHYSSDNIFAEVTVAPDSPWFSGHFPGSPILPGMAIISMVFDAIQRSRRTPLTIAGLKKVRFKRVVEPDDRIDLKVTRSENDPFSYFFQVTCSGEVACTGTMTTAPSSRQIDKT
jgi:3-hydroxymyristoyl/3-hydroxydecanoyl-(acyl carrier protein) dehydratase